jgi:hypothetical protein
MDRRYTVGMKLIQTLIFCAACVLSLSATAQWQWLDRDGRTVFSDTPPPVDIPEKNILRQPRGRAKISGVPTAAPGQDATGAATQADGSAAKPVGADKELLDKKKQVEKQAADAAAAKRKAEEERVAKTQADNCARAQQAKAGLDSGMRMARTNEKGEREIYDETMRAEEAQRLQGVINENCK